ncbi:MAG: metal-dependent hydrolase [Alcanivoracaceae bacterium]
MINSAANDPAHIQGANVKTRSPSVHPPVPIRHMDFNFDESRMPKYCWNNNSWGSAYILTFSAVLPAGERFIIDSVRELRDGIRNPELRDRATGLIGQEAIHSRIHGRFNELYELKGLPMRRIEELSHKLYVEFILPKLSDKNRLAIACGIEHLTAVMAEEAFGRQPEGMELLDESTRDFMVWHLLEELEHKSVAFDIYNELDGSYLRRVAAFLGIWAVSVPFGLYAVNEMLKTPGFDQGKKSNRQGYGYWFNYLTAFSPKLLEYFRPDFHPDDSDTSELLEIWKNKLFGNKGRLTGLITKTINPSEKRTSSARKLAS